MSGCTGCENNSGYYTPAFSPNVLVNCQLCNADFSKGGIEWNPDGPDPFAVRSSRAGFGAPVGLEGES